jgi:hypothetical protein
MRRLRIVCAAGPAQAYTQAGAHSWLSLGRQPAERPADRLQDERRSILGVVWSAALSLCGARTRTSASGLTRRLW